MGITTRAGQRRRWACRLGRMMSRNAGGGRKMESDLKYR
jgi:hypothetical protein